MAVGVSQKSHLFQEVITGRQFNGRAAPSWLGDLQPVT